MPKRKVSQINVIFVDFRKGARPVEPPEPEPPIAAVMPVPARITSTDCRSSTRRGLRRAA